MKRSELARRIERDVTNKLAAQGIYSGPEFYSVLNRSLREELPQCRTCKHLRGLKGRDHLLVMPTGAVFGSCARYRGNKQCNFKSVDVEGCDLHEHDPQALENASALERASDESEWCEEQRKEIGEACGVCYDTDQGTFAAPHESVMQGIKDGYRALMNEADNSHTVYAARARIAELETQLAERDKTIAELHRELKIQADASNEADEEYDAAVESLRNLRACIDDHGTWPSREAEDAGNYEACIKHMAKLLKEKACLFSESVKTDVRIGEVVDVPNWRRFLGHHCRFTVEALYPTGERIENEEHK